MNNIEFLKKEWLINNESYHNLEGGEFNYLESDDYGADALAKAAAIDRSIMPGAVAPKTVTFTLALSNGITTALTTSLQIFNSYTNRTLTNQGLNTNITATCKSTVSYLQFLAMSENEAFEIKQTLIVCSSSAQATATTYLAVTSTDGNGDQNTKSIDLYKKPDQYLDTHLICSTPIRIEGFTGISIPTLLGSASITFYFTIERRASQANRLFAGDAAKQYATPAGQFLLK